MYLRGTGPAPANWHIAQHALAVVQHLKNGERLEKALEMANTDKPPAKYDPSNPGDRTGLNDMELSDTSDPKARLIGVYISGSEWTQDLEDKLKGVWYWFKD